MGVQAGARGVPAPHRWKLGPPRVWALPRALGETDKGLSVRLSACGPAPMLQAVTALAATHGRSTDVSLEQVMGCGLGGCYSCVVPVAEPGQPTRFVRSCLQGPVFDGGRIDWDQL